MLTYMVYEERDKKISEMLFLLRSFEKKGVLGKSEWENESELCNRINTFLSMHIDKEWQLIILDGKELYAVDNPYESKEREEKIKRLLNQSQQDSGQYKKNMKLFPPKYILLLSARRNRLIKYPLSSNIYSDFYKQYSSNCRFWVVNIPEEEDQLTDKVIFRLLCGLLVLLANDISEMVMERQYLYELSWQMEQKEVENDLKEMLLRHNRIEELLMDNSRLNDCEGEYFQDFPVPVFYLGGSKQIEKVNGNVKSFLKKDENDVLIWEIQNNIVLEQINKLMESPVGRWEKEIEEAKWNTLEDMDMLKGHIILLNQEARYRLRKAKEKCAEGIFKLKLNVEEKGELLNKAVDQEKQIIRAIRTRMTWRSFCKSFIEIALGTILILFFGFGLSGGMKEDKLIRITFIFVCAVFIISFIIIEILLYCQRIYVKDKLNITIKKINNCLKNDDFKYNSLLASITQHKKYSLLEQEQREFDYIRDEKKIILKKHKKELAMFEQHIRKLCWILGYTPDISKEKSEKKDTGFLKDMEYFGYYYLPSLDLFYKTIIRGWGNNILVPFSYMKRIGVEKVCLMRNGSADGRKKEEDE